MIVLYCLILVYHQSISNLFIRLSKSVQINDTKIAGLKKKIKTALLNMCARRKSPSKKAVEKPPEVMLTTKISYGSKTGLNPKIAPDSVIVQLRFDLPQELMDRQIQKYRNIEDKLLYYGMISEDSRKDLQTVQEEVVMGIYTIYLNRDPLRIPIDYKGSISIIKK